MDRASLFTDHRISGRPILAKYKHLEQFESMFVAILQQISFLLLWSGGHRCMEKILCRVVASSCWLTHNIAPHTSLHDLPYHKTMKKYEDFQSMKLFCSTRWNSRFKHGSVIVHNIFSYFTLSLSASQVYMIKERCWFSPSRLLCWVLSTSDQCFFLSSQFYVIHIHR